eukprot:TRINITY_DN29478_c0_g1_i1.p1 TRINITY_DN29478_c0_g1~~TRINITY_DN29478_c0_g1_i1.p1  ORF type:complete len:478 (+),score=134.25 TRINITY_DN29478_c0_g1_i1:51-1436(+)
MSLVLILVASCGVMEEEDTGMFTDGCKGRIESKLRWQAYCSRKFDLSSDEQSKVFCGMEGGVDAEQWGYASLTDLLTSLLTEDPAVPVKEPPVAAAAIDYNQTKDLPLPNACSVHRLEKRYWEKRPDLRAHSVTMYQKLARKECWDVIPAATLTTCTHKVERCLNYSMLIDTECKNETAPRRVHTRQLGKTCPTLSQLKTAFAPVLGKKFVFKEEYLRDFLGKFTVLVGDSITRGTGAYRYHKRKLDGWGIRLFWGAKQWGEEMLGIRKGDQCVVAKDGLSTHKLRLEMQGKGISKHYYVVNAPRKLVHQCFKDSRPDRRPSTVVLNIGANDFLDNTNIVDYERNLKWLIGKMQHWSGGSLKGLILAIHPFPVNGRREAVSGGLYQWKTAVVDAVHRVALWTRTEYNPTHARGNRSYSWVTVHDFNTPLSWCAEYNFADGIHPNARGHFLLAIDFLRSMIK